MTGNSLDKYQDSEPGWFFYIIFNTRKGLVQQEQIRVPGNYFIIKPTVFFKVSLADRIVSCKRAVSLISSRNFIGTGMIPLSDISGSFNICTK